MWAATIPDMERQIVAGRKENALTCFGEQSRLRSSRSGPADQTTPPDVPAGLPRILCGAAPDLREEESNLIAAQR